MCPLDYQKFFIYIVHLIYSLTILQVQCNPTVNLVYLLRVNSKKVARVLKTNRRAAILPDASYKLSLTIFVKADYNKEEQLYPL